MVEWGVARVSVDRESPAKETKEDIWKSKSSNCVDKPASRYQNLIPGRKSGRCDSRPSSKN